jgi:ADP-heptose:LPS heptosyltransferase
MPGVLASSTAVGPLRDRWPDIDRIVVLRGGGLGDLLSAVPAMEALVAAYPGAELDLLCAPNIVGLFADRPSPVSRAIPLPFARGVHEPDAMNTDGGDEKAFHETLSARPIDLGVQLHGGGRWSNSFLLNLGPRWTVGTRTDDAAQLTRWLPYRYYQHEMSRWLEVVGLAGAPPVSFQPRIEVTESDLNRSQQLLPGDGMPTISFHPGARDGRRCWPPEYFGKVIAACVQRGARAVLVGTRTERPLLARIADDTRRRLPTGSDDAVVVLDGVDLASLCGVLACSDVLVGNDSGVRHLAQAVGTATVGIFWLGNAITAGPLGRYRHRVLMSWTVRCPVCGRDCTQPDFPRCEHDVSFVADVTPDEVLSEVEQLMP